MIELNEEILNIRKNWEIGQISDSEFLANIEYYKELAWKDSRSNTGSCLINLLFPDTLKTATGVDLPKLSRKGLNIEVKESRSNNSFTIHPKEYVASDLVLLYSHVFDEFYLVPTKNLMKINTKGIKRGYRIPQLKENGLDLPKNVLKLIKYIRKIREEGI